MLVIHSGATNGWHDMLVYRPVYDWGPLEVVSTKSEKKNMEIRWSRFSSEATVRCLTLRKSFHLFLNFKIRGKSRKQNPKFSAVNFAYLLPLASFQLQYFSLYTHFSALATPSRETSLLSVTCTSGRKCWHSLAAVRSYGSWWRKTTHTQHPIWKWPEAGLGLALFLSDLGFTEKVNQAAGPATRLFKGSSENLFPSSSGCWQMPHLWGFRIGDLQPELSQVPGVSWMIPGSQS